MGGPVQYHWCYLIERCQKVLRIKCKNKCKIEASIAESYILEEVSNFTTKYYGEKLPIMHNPPPHYNAGDNDRVLEFSEDNLEVQGMRGTSVTPKMNKGKKYAFCMGKHKVDSKN